MKYNIPTLMALSQVTDVVCNWTSNARECNLIRPGLNKRPVLKEASVNIAVVSSAVAQQSGEEGRSKAKSPSRPKTTTHSTLKPSFTPTEAGFARFLQEHSSPPHQRVTAGGRIVPMDHPARASQMLGESSINDMDSVGSSSDVTVVNIHNMSNPAPTAHRASASNAASLNPEAPTFMPGYQAPVTAAAPISPVQMQYQNRVMSLVQHAVQHALRPRTMSGAHVNPMPYQDRVMSLAQHAGGPPTMSGAHNDTMLYQNGAMNLIQHTRGPPITSGSQNNPMQYQNGAMNLIQHARGPPIMSGTHNNPMLYQNREMNLMQHARGPTSMSGTHNNPMLYQNREMNLMQHAGGPTRVSGTHNNTMLYQNREMHLMQHAGGPPTMYGAHVDPGAVNPLTINEGFMRYQNVAVDDVRDTAEAPTDDGVDINPQQSQAGFVIIPLKSLEEFKDRHLIWPPDLPNDNGETTWSHMRMQIAAQNLVGPVPIPNAMQYRRLRQNPALRVPTWQPIPFAFPRADIMSRDADTTFRDADIMFRDAIGPGGLYWITLIEIFRVTNEGRYLTLVEYRARLFDLVRVVAAPKDKYHAFMLLHAIDWLTYHEWLFDELIASVYHRPGPLMGPTAHPEIEQHYQDLRAEVKSVIRFLRQAVRRHQVRTAIYTGACDFWRDLAFSALYGSIPQDATQDNWDASTESEMVAPWDRDSWSDEIATDQNSNSGSASGDGKGDAEGEAHADDGPGKGVEVVCGDQTSLLSAGRGTHVSILEPTGSKTARGRRKMSVVPVTPPAQITKDPFTPPAAVTRTDAHADKGKLSDVETMLARLRC